MTHNNKVIQITIRLKKEDSAFLYFQLEANEGLSFYSTLDHEKGSGHRDIEINIPEDFIEEVERILNKLAESVSMTVLSKETLEN